MQPENPVKLQGRRLADGEMTMEPGDYSKIEAYSGDEFVCIMWWMKSPIGGPIFQIGPKPIGGGYEVEENEDGTITVQPHEGNSNSILVSWPNGKSWHGYIYNGEWRTA